jgi:hypothetical protein
MSSESEFYRQHQSPELRAAVIRKLEDLSERFPNLRLGQLLVNATTGRDLFNLEDDELLRMLDQLWVTYTQFEAAGVRKEQFR